MSAGKVRVEGYVAHALTREAAHATAVDLATSEGRMYALVPAASGGVYVIEVEAVVRPSRDDLRPALRASLELLARKETTP